MLKKLKDSLLSTLPVIVVVLVLHFAKIAIIPNPGIWVFLLSSLLVVIGSWLFNIGAESSMSKMGELVGSSLTKKRSMGLLIIIFFLFGLFITIAEPDISVLAEQVNINSIVLIVSIGVGVGIFLVVGALRILFQQSLKLWLLACYALMFALATLVDSSLLPLSLDSGGVTTGPITVPFILALGIGIATSRGSKNTNSDSFGLVAFASIGPIIAVMILSLILRDGSSYEFKQTIISDFGSPFINSLIPHNGELGTIIQVLISLSPIVIFFIIYNFVFLKLPGKKFGHTLFGVTFVYLGLVLFMTGVQAGFLPIGETLGMEIAKSGESSYWILALVGAFLGIAAVFAEPAVQVLTKQIEVVSDGNIKKISVLIALAIGNGLAIALAIIRAINPGFNLLYIIVPGYIIAFTLSFLVPDIYSAIAFDSGGVVSGPMNTTFILPYAIGACYVINPNSVATNAFGTIALVALMPLITITFIGFSAKVKVSTASRIARNRIRDEFDDQIIHF